MDFYLDLLPILASGAVVTLAITALSMLLGMVVGLFIALGKLSAVRPVRWFAYWYIEVIRGTPLLVQLFLIYFGLPQFGIRLPAFVAGVLGIGLNYSAYLAEVYRAGIEAVPRGQREAGLSMGLTDRQIMRDVILPQAVRIILPPIGNYLISCLKDSALASTITVNELMREGQLASAATFRSFEIFITVAILYFLLSYPVSRFVARLERRYGSYA